MITPTELKQLGFEPLKRHAGGFYTTFRLAIGVLLIDVTTDLEAGLQTVEIGIMDSWHRCNNIPTILELRTLIQSLK